MKPKKRLATCNYSDRMITVVDGVAFYRSTGQNSSHKDIWFPFFGIDEMSVESLVFRTPNTVGWLVKPSAKILLKTMKQDETLYFVNPSTNLDQVSWEQLPARGQKSVLLLQCAADESLKARYISPDHRSSHSFIYGTNTEIYQSKLTTLFGQETLLSLNDIERILTEEKRSFVTRMRALRETPQADLDLTYAALTAEERHHFTQQERIYNQAIPKLIERPMLFSVNIL